MQNANVDLAYIGLIDIEAGGTFRWTGNFANGSDLAVDVNLNARKHFLFYFLGEHEL